MTKLRYEHCQTSNVFGRFIFWFDHKTFSSFDFGLADSKSVGFVHRFSAVCLWLSKCWQSKTALLKSDIPELLEDAVQNSGFYCFAVCLVSFYIFVVFSNSEIHHP